MERDSYGWVDRRVDGPTLGRMGRCGSGWADGRLADFAWGWLTSKIDRWMECGWLDGRMDIPGWVGAWLCPRGDDCPPARPPSPCAAGGRAGGWVDEWVQGCAMRGGTGAADSAAGPQPAASLGAGGGVCVCVFVPIVTPILLPPSPPACTPAKPQLCGAWGEPAGWQQPGGRWGGSSSSSSSCSNACLAGCPTSGPA